MLAAGIWIVLTAGSLAIVLRVVLALPADYFERNQTVRVSWTLRRIARDLAGVLLVVAGAVLSIPGVPDRGCSRCWSACSSWIFRSASAWSAPSRAGRPSSPR